MKASACHTPVGYRPVWVVALCHLTTPSSFLTPLRHLPTTLYTPGLPLPHTRCAFSTHPLRKMAPQTTCHVLQPLPQDSLPLYLLPSPTSSLSVVARAILPLRKPRLGFRSGNINSLWEISQLNRASVERRVSDPGTRRFDLKTKEIPPTLGVSGLTLSYLAQRKEESHG